MNIRPLPKKTYLARHCCVIVTSSLLLTSSLFLSEAQSGSSKPVAPQRSIQRSLSGEGSINGHVVDEAGQPLPRVVIYILPVNGEYDDRREAITDDKGAFNVDGLSAKAYTVECEASGYVEYHSENFRGYHLIGDSVTLKMFKGGVITGKVLDASGEPLVKAEVSMQRVRDGKSRPLSVAESWGHVVTDDRGIYRAYGLEEGYYILKVGQVGEYEDDELRNQSPTYYPSSTADAGGEVAVRRGAEISGIDIVRRDLRGHTVSGRCTGATHKGSTEESYVKLIHAKNRVLQAGGWQGYQQNRAFTFYGVPDGDYYVIAQDDYDEPGAASQLLRVKVEGNDITRLELRLSPFSSIAGQVVIESVQKSARTPECKPRRELSAPEVVARALRVLDDQNDLINALFGSDRSSLPDAKGNFILDRLPPGRYHLGMDLVSEDYYVRSITTAGQSPERRIPGSPLMLKSGENITGVVVDLSDGAAGVRGRIIAADQITKPPAGLRVHLVPADVNETANTMRFLVTDASDNGEFAFKNVAPGRYRLLARSNASWQTSAPEVSESVMRNLLLREAAAADNSIQLQPCQRTANYLLHYLPTSAQPSRKATTRVNSLNSVSRNYSTAR